MNAITPWLLCLALFVMLGAAVYAIIKIIHDKNVVIKSLEAEVAKQKQNMAYLVKHTEEIAKIEQSEDQLQEEIRNAKSDEEVADIINAIININNAKLCDKAKG
jgi:predicted amino acid-binding ACT domain protein